MPSPSRSSLLRKYRAARYPVYFCACGWLLLVLTARYKGPSAVVHGSSAQLPNEQFTIVINTFRRLDLLEESIRHYSQCDSVNRIHVNWAESETPPDVAAHVCCGQLVTFATPKVTHGDTSLNTRFLPISDLETEAVLNVDDDIITPCQGLTDAFRVWQRNREQLVGWFPRATPRHANGHYTYASKQQTLASHGQYSVILTKGAFMHSKYLDLYTSSMPAGIHAMIAQDRNCEDLAMQFLVSAASQQPPVFVWDTNVLDKGAWPHSIKGISSAGSSHMAARSHCLDALHKAFPALTGALPAKTVSGSQRLSPFRDAMSALSMALRGHRSSQCSCARQSLAQL